MQSVQLRCTTWQRQDSYGMYDYSLDRNNLQSQILMVNRACRVMRSRRNYNLITLPIGGQQGDQRHDQQYNDHDEICRLLEVEGHFFLADKNGDTPQGENSKKDTVRQPLLKIVNNMPNGHLIQAGDHLKLGKIVIDIIQLHWKRSVKNNHYEDLVKPSIANQRSMLTPSFYTSFRADETASMVQTNPACRYCYSKSITANNPFLTICLCSGSTKYIHAQCLLQWIKKRNGVIIDHQVRGIYCTQVKSMTCELCHQIYRVDKLMRGVFNVEEDQLQQYMVLNVNNSMLYVIDLMLVEEIMVGRSLENDLVINDLSVSRNHCRMEINANKKQVRLFNQKGKFGTAVEIDKCQVKESQEEFQKGRTNMKIQLIRKKSFFQRLGFCSPMENLKNQKKK